MMNRYDFFWFKFFKNSSKPLRFINDLNRNYKYIIKYT